MTDRHKSYREPKLPAQIIGAILGLFDYALPAASEIELVNVGIDRDAQVASFTAARAVYFEQSNIDRRVAWRGQYGGIESVQLIVQAEQTATVHLLPKPARQKRGS